MNWTLENYDRLVIALGEHVMLVGIALAISLAIAFPLGIWSARRRAVYVVVMAVTGVLYTVPALALFALLIPFMGLGTAPAITALVLYSLLILIRNIATGIRELPAELIEAADGMGYGPWRRLWKIELPLALPVIVAGIRITAVTQISVATVAAYISAGGLGDIIFQGITQDFGEKIVAGAVVTSLLAILADETLRRLERRLRAVTAERCDARRGRLDRRASEGLHAGRKPASRAVGHRADCRNGRRAAACARHHPLRAGRQRGDRRRECVAHDPSLALLVIMLPFLGTGFVPAVVALTLYGLPAILINTYTGLREVDRDIVEAARGQGMTDGETMRRIEIPLALPVIFAGIRTAAVQIVSAATLAAFIGGGGLGELITAGMGVLDMPQLVVGGLAVALLAVATELGFAAIEWRARRSYGAA